MERSALLLLQFVCGSGASGLVVVMQTEGKELTPASLPGTKRKGRKL